MQYIIYIILSLIILVLLIYNRKKIIKITAECEKQIQLSRQQQIEEFTDKEKYEIENRILRETEELYEQKRQVEQTIKDKTEYVESLLEQIRSINQTLNDQREHAKVYEEQLCESARQRIGVYEQDLMKIAESKASAYEQEKLKAAEVSYSETMALLGAQAETARAQIEVLTKEIAEYSAKQTAINEAIMRQRAIDEQQDFYKIRLSNEAKSDINYLISIVPNFKNPTALYKLIWSEYIQKQFNQMLKNVLGATDPRNVIYSITNLKTNEVYIGKTKAEVSKRWSEHVKSSLNIGTIKSAKIHEALYNHWDEFAFAIVEKVPLEEDLSKREKFYIDFYQSNIYGYNLKSGG